MHDTPEHREQLLQHYRAMRSHLLETIGGLSDAQLIEPTIDGWSVKDHLAHIGLWDDIRADEIARISAGYDSAWRVDEEQGDAFHELGYVQRRAFSLEQARWEFERAHLRVLDALERAPAHGLDDSRYGDASLWSDHESEHTDWIARWRGERGY